MKQIADEVVVFSVRVPTQDLAAIQVVADDQFEGRLAMAVRRAIREFVARHQPQSVEVRHDST